MAERSQQKNNSPGPPFSNTQWVELLSAPPDEQAVDELRRILVRGLRPSLAKYVDRELDQFIEDVAQDSVLQILDNIESFRGESKFTTWAMKIAVRQGLSILRRKRWDNISIEELTPPDDDSTSAEEYSSSFADEKAGPEEQAALTIALEKLQKMIDKLLTDRQRKVFQALIIQDMPISVVAEKMNTNRNNLYKLVHDARKKIREQLEVQGIDPDEMLQRLTRS